MTGRKAGPGDLLPWQPLGTLTPLLFLGFPCVAVQRWERAHRDVRNLRSRPHLRLIARGKRQPSDSNGDDHQRSRGCDHPELSATAQRAAVRNDSCVCTGARILPAILLARQLLALPSRGHQDLPAARCAFRAATRPKRRTSAQRRRDIHPSGRVKLEWRSRSVSSRTSGFHKIVALKVLPRERRSANASPKAVDCWASRKSGARGIGPLSR
jgi:hypothetical protein